MRHSVFIAAMVWVCLASIGCSDDPASLHVGMSHDDAIRTLESIGAEDVSSGMQVALPEGQDLDSLREGIWAIDGYEVTLETTFTDGKLSAMNVWDATIPQDRYHALMEHRRIERIDFAGDGKTYEMDVIEVIPAS